jgi:hypothetical protein
MDVPELEEEGKEDITHIVSAVGSKLPPPPAHTAAPASPHTFRMDI